MTGLTVSSTKVWNPETEELLRRLWSEGQSAQKISDQIPGSTRNGVIGKKHRLGLENHKQAPSQNPARTRIRRERVMATKPAQLSVFLPRPPEGPWIPFMKANDSTCRSVEGYEVDENGHTLAVFCSNPKTLEASWCPFHMGIYYRPATR